MWQAVERVRTIVQLILGVAGIGTLLAVYFKFTVPGWLTILCVGLGIAIGFVLGAAIRPQSETNAEEPKQVAQQFTGHRIIVNGMLDDDPRIYLDIKPHTTDSRDRFICHNRGKDTAHNVQIQPFKLAGHTVTFNSIGSLGPDENGYATPRVEDGGGLTSSFIFYWLIKDWDKGGELVGEWPVQITVTYANSSNSREFTGTSTLMFYPIKHQTLESFKAPMTEKTWDFKNPQFASHKV